MMIAMLELKASLAVEDLSFTEGAVCFWNIEVALRRWVCLLEGQRQELAERYDVLFLF